MPLDATSDSEKSTDTDNAEAHVKHDEKAEPVIGSNGDDMQSFRIDESELPKGYFLSRFFIGTMAAICCNLAAAVGGFALLAPILTQVNNDIGPSGSILWVALVYTITLAIGLVLVGRLSDLFGRRWFFISGNFLGLIGCIVCATAKTVPVLIGGETLVGLAAATGASYPFVVGEIVPMKYRFITSSFVYLFQIPTSCMGPAVAYAFVLNTKQSWRWCYYYLIIWNAVALVLWTCFYFPPTFYMKHGNQSKLRFLKDFDYIGTGLFIAGIVLFLMGLSWGGSLYPWKSAHVIATIVFGLGTLIAFGFYESLASLKEPFIPMHLFKRGPWVATTMVIAICGGVFYAFAIVWPTMASTLYSRTGDSMYTGYIATLIGSGITLGEIIGGLLARRIGKTKYQLMTTWLLASIFLGCVATCNENTKTQAIALLFIGTTFVGYTDGVAINITTIEIADQQDIGIAAGVVGAVRSIVGAMCAAIYSAILTNRLNQTIPEQVPAALIQAGLPADSVASFLSALSIGTPAAFTAVNGITPNILAVGAAAYKHASSDAYRTVFLSSIAFSGIGIILTFFTPSVDHRMTGEVSVALRHHTTSTGGNLEEAKP